ncbi:cellulose biosynthesis cyclic di-GMP-binding regulatory protein BcsB [Kaistia dalseonensis]|uniref:Cyclic di-GMP-binding protein n=1 Tax=Kaistia dalseonensis TaxID=410840 RepID=A0ABU0HB42_9HYPH|nr:cellulose biosynthesis cyclic di-GMP-binding regulatory protein BcsB [Kaistia dalseonensis]MCX5496908.1 cellulose biosynthesis cyclic di-GMP-binding regulatory protein BcsB [Kaistia dalseonensis]MDQ0439533.1 hypothetical protein [Kaistia dalseonensis]
MIGFPRLLPAALIVIGATCLAAAQTGQPFDMSTERGNMPIQPSPVSPSIAPAPAPFGTGVAPLRPSTAVNPLPPPVAVNPLPAPMVNSQPAPPVAVSPLPTPVAPVPAPVTAPAPALQTPAPVAPVAPAFFAASANRRYIIPQAALRFQGEIDQRAWTITLSNEQAGRSARIDVSYKNAIVVMPEASRLRVLLNDQPVLETALASSDSFRTVSAAIPAGLTLAGANMLRFQISQRHRTDCSIASTFELWTDIDPAGTTLTFDGDLAPPVLRQLDDVAAVGYDAKGVTSIHMIVPTRNQAAVAAPILKLSQIIGMVGAFPNPRVTISDSAGEPDGPGTLTVLVGTASEIQPFTSAPINEASPLAPIDFIDDPAIGANVMVVSAGSWSQIEATIDALAKTVNRPVGIARKTLDTASWFAPEVRYFRAAETVRLSDVGVPTQEFSGRRFRTSFGVGIPSDFYASAYGEATLLLDAAYTAAVLPASHIDIYVNDQIAATTRIVTHGGIFRHLPIQIPLRHFHPGVNRITIEAMLDTAADQVCAPGGSTAGPARFVLFDTTEFSMPTFARIGQLPNLAALSGTAYPYMVATSPTPLVLAGAGRDTISAAATFVSRLAIQGGRIISFVPTQLTAVGNQSAIIIGAAPQIPAGLFSQMGISEAARTSWREDLPRPAQMSFSSTSGGGTAPVPGGIADAGTPADLDSENTEITFNKWKDELAGGGGWRGQITAFEDWMRRTFDISFSALRLGPADSVIYEPRAKTTLILAQAASPDGSGTWTLLTAPSERQLMSGTQAIAGVETWTQVGGQISTFTATTGRIENQLPARTEFIVTQPLSFQNVRLIAANWLSSNIIFYAIGLMVLCLALGGMTSLLLRRLGRPS